MRFLIDSCAGNSLAAWLRSQGHDVLNADEMRPDPGDRALLQLAHAEDRILVTIDTDFGRLIFVEETVHAGLVRLPDIPARQRIELMSRILDMYPIQLQNRAIITVSGNRIRITDMS